MYEDPTIEKRIQEVAAIAPRITPADIEASISSELVFTVGVAAKALQVPVSASVDLLTICVLTLNNGFTVTGDSACASPENFNAETCIKIARQNAVAKIWPLLGYELRTKLSA